MSYCIFRTEKRKSKLAVYKSACHNTRDERRKSKSKNIDWSRHALNDIDRNVQSVMQQYERKLPKKVRSNGVHAVELLFTASGDFEGWDAYFKDCKVFADSILGGAENCISWAVHRDELTDHVHAIYMPLKDGKLNSRFYIGGHRENMRELQNKFFQEVGKKHGLERGELREKTDARHTAPKLKAAVKDLQKREANLKKRNKEADADYAELEKAAKNLRKRERLLDKSNVQELEMREDYLIRNEKFLSSLQEDIAVKERKIQEKELKIDQIMQEKEEEIKQKYQNREQNVLKKEVEIEQRKQENERDIQKKQAEMELKFQNREQNIQKQVDELNQNLKLQRQEIKDEKEVIKQENNKLDAVKLDLINTKTELKDTKNLLQENQKMLAAQYDKSPKLLRERANYIESTGCKNIIESWFYDVKMNTENAKLCAENYTSTQKLVGEFMPKISSETKERIKKEQEKELNKNRGVSL